MDEFCINNNIYHHKTRPNLKRSNNIPMQVLNYLTSIEKRQKLLNK